MVQTSRRLVLEWQALVCRAAALRKAFISVKGFYLQVCTAVAFCAVLGPFYCGFST